MWVASKRLNLVSLQFGDFLAGGVAYSPTGFIDLFGYLHRLYSRVMKQLLHHSDDVIVCMHRIVPKDNVVTRWAFRNWFLCNGTNDWFCYSTIRHFIHFMWGQKTSMLGRFGHYCTFDTALLGKHNSEEKNKWIFRQDRESQQNPQNR